MKILHLSTYDTKGGGARSTLRLHTGLLEQDVDSTMFVMQKGSNLNTVKSYRWPVGRWGRLKRNRIQKAINKKYQTYKETVPLGYEPFTNDLTPNFNLIDQLPNADLINLHWIAHFVDINDLFINLRHVPIIWRLSDMNPITGGCHYDDGCGKYISGCHTCPQLGSKTKHDLSNEIWNRKYSLFEKINEKNLHFVAQSNWMAENIKSSAIFSRFGVTVIPNGLNTQTFQPRDKKFSRKLFGIPENKKVILFVSDEINNRRKGFDLLIKAFNQINSNEEVLLCAVGNLRNKDLFNENILELGNIADDRLLSLAFAMADLFVIPSIQDNLPNTVIEALACGTPVIGFPIGGIKDMIQHGENGYLCHEISIEALVKSLNEFIEKPNRFDRTIIRKEAVKSYDTKIQAAKMKSLYSDILDKFHAN